MLAPEHDNQHRQTLLENMSAEQRVDWALEHLPGPAVLSSSFGAQAAVMLHLCTRAQADMPVVFIDTGYHFADTYRFVDQLTERLQLNLQVYRAYHSAAWQEARYGQRWEQGLAGIKAYNQENKVEPMRRALAELGSRLWFSGLRRDQATSRAQLAFLERRSPGWKCCPIADWNDREVYRYLKKHALPYHPLWAEGYVSIGDWHTTRSLKQVSRPAETRFFGLKRECGLHDGL